jgi:peptidoglycan/LPS O-acetylase OafA/YrhL
MKSLAYRPQLDGLRCIAVSLVLVHHFLDTTTYAGMIGVRLFFVLSGFLITTILLDAKTQIDDRRSTVLSSLRQFYIRRSLRIFPAFYLVVLVGWAAGLPEIVSPLWWHLTYTTNLLFARQGYFDDHTAHLWSLAVEEQFYIVWPLLVLLASRRTLIRITVVLIAAGPILRAAVMLIPLNGTAFTVVPLAATDSLAAGALLALLRATPWQGTFSRIGLVSIVASMAFLLTGWRNYIVFDTVLSLGFSWLVAGAFAGFKGAAGRVLEVSPVRYLGKISYGIYLYHGFVPLILSSALPTLHYAMPLAPGLGLFAIGSAVTILLAAVSWHFYERPLNALKDRWTRSTADTASRTSAARAEPLPVRPD